MADGTGIRFAPELFRRLGPRTDARDETVRVVSGAPDLAAAALAAASKRFMLVVHDGRELGDEDELQTYVVAAHVEFGAPRYHPHSPSTVDPVLNVDGHPGTSIELKTIIPAPMADRFRTILREELSRAGIHEAQIEPFALTPDLPDWTVSS